MHDDDQLARLVWQFAEPVHAVTYFAPETRAATDALGLKGGWMSYFGCRAAPLGAVTAPVVTAAFYNFHPVMVRRAIPDAWTFATPQQLLEARWEAIDAALHRLLGDAQLPVRAAAELVDAADFSGRALGAANAAVEPPSAPRVALWQSLAAIREHRGDGHVASLIAHGIGPCEALVLQAATKRSPQEGMRTNRGWSSDEWTDATRRLQASGWLDADENITAKGEAMRNEVEADTDRLASSIVSAGRDVAVQLIDALRPLAELVMAAKVVPAANNMGVPWPPRTGY